jgi:hypothetical protein
MSGRRDFYPATDIREPVDLVEPAAADDADTAPPIRVSVNRCPDLALHRVEHAGGDDQKKDHLEPQVTVVEVGPRPNSGNHHVVRHLRHARRTPPAKVTMLSLSGGGIAI